MAKSLDLRIIRSHKALITAGLSELNRNREATFSEIAKKAKVGRSTLYRLFENREALIKAITLHCLEQIDEATVSIEQDAVSAFDAILKLLACIVPLTKEYQFLVNLQQWQMLDEEVTAVSIRHKSELMELVEMAKREGSVAESMPTEWVVNMIEGLLYAGWLQQNESGVTETVELVTSSMRAILQTSNR